MELLCRTGHGAKGNTFIMGLVHPNNVTDHRPLRKLSAAAQENPGRA
jgi:hypothetical protein